jgi:hypothetical protein
MFLNTRRFSVWLLSFLAVLVIYFIYNRVSRTPAVSPGGSKQGVDLISDACELNGEVGKVGDVGIGAVKNARYIKRNAQKQIVGEFGFDELLHQDGNDWEIKNPYYTAIRRGFECTISGERAKVTVETSGGTVMPKQGLLTGNVKIRIWPKSTEGMGEAVIYLDDIFFKGEQSLFTTSGQVELVSQDIRLEGRGMELIYDSDAERLDLLKINRLQSLNIKNWSRGNVLEAGGITRQGDNSGREVKRKDTAGSKYKCVLDKNVVIETLKERLLAEIVSINDIFIAGGTTDPCLQNAGAGESEAQAVSSSQSTQKTASAETGRGDNSFAVEHEGDVAINCNGSVVITPMDSAIDEDTGTVTVNCEQSAGRVAGKTTFCGGKINYSVETGAAIAEGPSIITFDVNDANQSKPTEVVITAQRQARFEPAINKVSFEGDGRCTISQTDVNAIRRYFVLADSLEVDLTPKESNKPGTSLDVQRLVAFGGDVRLASTKKAGERLLAGIELKCARIYYNTVSRDFVATGPGLIKMDNSQTDEPQKGLSRFSLRRKCYAFLRNFYSLEFNGAGSHLVADSNGGSLLVDYFPLGETRSTPDKGIRGQARQAGGEDKVAVTASHVEADILEKAGGRMELGGLVATGAITYEDKDVEIIGNEFVYDADKQSVDVRGTQSHPCRFNGAIMDSVQGNLKTGKWNTKIKGPGTIR